MKSEILATLHQSLKHAEESNQPQANLSLLRLIQNRLGGVILTHPEDQTPLLLHQPEESHLLWLGHVDIVPKHQHQQNSIDQDRLFSRGAFDMLGSVSSFMHTLTHKPQLQQSVGFLITSDEETGGNHGAKWLIDSNLINLDLIRGVIVGEPTNLNIVISSKGLLVVGVDIHGRPAHASEPWKGISASLAATEFCHRLQHQLFSQPTSPEDMHSSFNLGSILSGGNHTNIIPELAQLIFDIRYVDTDSPSLLLTRFEEILTQLKRDHLLEDFLVTTRMEQPPETCPPRHPLVTALASASTSVLGRARQQLGVGVTDGRHFVVANPQLPIIRFGPTGDHAHSPNEWVSIESLIQESQILSRFFQEVQNEA